MKKFIIILIIVAVLVIGWYALSPFFIRNSANDQSPLAAPGTASSTPNIIAEGSFTPSAHEVSGKVLLIEMDGKKTLRFEDFYTLNGPNLHVYLSKDLSNKDFVDISPLKATDGNVNYEVPASVDTNAYSHVLIWCKDFSVLFGSADLK